MSRLTRDGTAEPVSRDQILRHARGQGNVHFPCSADHEQDWQPYPVDPYSAICDDHTYIHTYRNPNPIHLCHLHELLLSLLLPAPPENSLVHLFWPALHPSQLLAPRNRESGAPGFCSSHSVYAQTAPHSHRRSTCPYFCPSYRRRDLLILRSSSSHSCSPQRGDPPFRS